MIKDNTKCAIANAVTLFNSSSKVIGSYDIVKCTVCGVNIKPIMIDKTADDEPTKGYDLGLFLHVRIPNGDQYDLIWRLHSDLEYDDESTKIAEKVNVYTSVGDIEKVVVPGVLFDDVYIMGKKPWKDLRNKKLLNKHTKLRFQCTTYPIIPNILQVLGVNEWVEIIGAPIYVNVPKMLPVADIGIDMSNPRAAFPIGCYNVEEYERSISDPDTADAYRTYPNYFEIHTSDEELLEYINNL